MNKRTSADTSCIRASHQMWRSKGAGKALCWIVAFAMAFSFMMSTAVTTNAITDEEEYDASVEASEVTIDEDISGADDSDKGAVSDDSVKEQSSVAETGRS